MAFRKGQRVKVVGGPMACRGKFGTILHVAAYAAGLPYRVLCEDGYSNDFSARELRAVGASRPSYGNRRRRSASSRRPSYGKGRRRSYGYGRGRY